MPTSPSPRTLTSKDAKWCIANADRVDFEQVVFLRFTPAAAKVLLDNMDVVYRRRGFADPVFREKEFGLQHLDFLTKLHNLHVAEREQNSLATRVAIATHLWTAATQGSTVTLDDIRSYKAHTVFDFGERQFDRVFEMGDGDQVRDAMVKLARRDRNAAEVCRDVMGWEEACDEDENQPNLYEILRQRA